MAHVGVSAAGSGAKKASLASTTVEMMIQKKMPTANDPMASMWRPTFDAVVAAMARALDQLSAEVASRVAVAMAARIPAAPSAAK